MFFLCENAHYATVSVTLWIYKYSAGVWLNAVNVFISAKRQTTIYTD